MRILVLAPQPFFRQRGTPIAVRMLVETLAEAGHRVDLLTFHEGESVPLGGARLHRISPVPFVHDIGPGFSLKKVVCDVALAVRAAQMLRQAEYDVIHAVEEAAFIAQGLGRATSTPYLFDMDSSMPQQLASDVPGAQWARPVLEAAEARALRDSAGAVVVCKALEERVQQAAPETPVLRLEDVSLLHGAEVDEDLREAFSVTGPLLMYVGNLERYQGIGLLIDAFQIACERGTPAHLAIIGGSDAHIKQYRARAATRGVADRVHFAGPRPLDDLGGYLRQADVLVSPRIEGTNTPMKIYSYLDSGRPVVATRKRTHTQVLDEEIAALAAPTPEALADAIGRLLNNEKQRDELASRARERVAEHYSPEAFRRKLTRFYDWLEEALPADDTPREAPHHPPSHHDRPQ